MKERFVQLLFLFREKTSLRIADPPLAFPNLKSLEMLCKKMTHVCQHTHVCSSLNRKYSVVRTDTHTWTFLSLEKYLPVLATLSS